jgi:HEAT repeat protein
MLSAKVCITMQTLLAFISKRKPGFLGLTAILLCFFHQPLYAHWYGSMVTSILRADAVVYAVVEKDVLPNSSNNKVVTGDSQNDIREFIVVISPDDSYFLGPLVVRPFEVLKGDTSLVGKNILRPSLKIDIGYGHLKPGRQAVFLKKNSNDVWEETEVYSEDQIPKLRCLCSILKEEREPVMVQKLIRLLQEPSSMCPQVGWKKIGDEIKRNLNYFDFMEPGSLEGLEIDIIDELLQIKDPASFDVLAGSLDGFSLKNKRTLLNWIIDTGDLRAVPILLRYLDSEDIEQSSKAAFALRWYFPDAPGVTEAFLNRWKTAQKSVRSEAIKYLIKRNPTQELVKANEELQQPKASTFALKARKAFVEGPAADAKKYCIQIIQDDSMNDSTRLGLADCIGTVLNHEEQDRYAPAIAPFLERIAGQSEDLARSAIWTATSVNHPAMKQALVAYLNREDKSFIEDVGGKFKAVMALQSLGEEARAMGARMLLQSIAKTLNGYDIDDFNMKEYLHKHLWSSVAALAWLGNNRDFEQARQLFKDNRTPEDINRLIAELRPLSEIKDEGAFWINLIEKQWLDPDAKLRNTEPDWFVMRLGHLRESRAIPVLLNLLLKESHGRRNISQALVQIGESAITRLKSTLLEAEDLSPYRDVFSALCRSQKEEILPFMRQLAKDRTIALPIEVWDCFSAIGTADDIVLLSSRDDYWRFGRNHFLRSALASMRDKFGYNLNGPIEKKSR